MFNATISYSGPGTQLVTDKWKIDLNTYMAGNKDYIVAQIDGRGSAGQGYRLLHEVYRRLGTVEVSDQLEVTEYLRDNLHFVDKRRVGIWGWSYGGYTAAMALANPLSLFQCGVSVAPVVSWKLYGKFEKLLLVVLRVVFLCYYGNKVLSCFQVFILYFGIWHTKMYICITTFGERFQYRLQYAI